MYPSHPGSSLERGLPNSPHDPPLLTLLKKLSWRVRRSWTETPPPRSSLPKRQLSSWHQVLEQSWGAKVFWGENGGDPPEPSKSPEGCVGTVIPTSLSMCGKSSGGTGTTCVLSLGGCSTQVAWGGR